MNKASGGDGILVELFQILKDDAVKVLHLALNMLANLENSAVAIGLEKVSFHSNAKECSNCHTIVLISHSSKVILKILQARAPRCSNWIYMFFSVSQIKFPFRKRKTMHIVIAMRAQSPFTNNTPTRHGRQ